MSSPTLRERFDPRDNSLSLLRLVLATTVAVVHAQAIGWADQPRIGGQAVGKLAVDAFFVISGFLVTRSAIRLPSVRRFLWHRALRILPGFWVCLLVVALVFAPLLAWLQGQSPAVVMQAPDSAPDFVIRNSALLIRQWDIAELNALTGDDPAMNGSLWTLFYEAACYVMLAGLAAFGLLRGPGRARHAAGLVHLAGRHALVPMTVVAWALYTSGVMSGPLVKFSMMFLLGGLGYVYAHRITFAAPLIVLAVAMFAASIFLMDDYRALGAAPFAYLLLWAVVGLPWRWEPPADVSYGMYVYHWPVELALVHSGLGEAGRVVFTATSVLVAAVVAYASWHLVERPALRRKDARWIERLPSLRVATS
jgi:peptidoglycan/LPS O-acetylase OafA/YrhL